MSQYPSKITLKHDEIHLWFTYDEQITESDLLSQYFSLINKEESTQQARFYFGEHRHQYLLTRALVRSVLSLYVNNIPPKNWLFCKNKYSKPEIANPEVKNQLYFNLSHTKGLIVLAVSRHHYLGVDVEKINDQRANLDMVEHIFCKQEVEALLYLRTKEQRINRFFELWTLKEAYIKARGIGLYLSLDQFGFLFPDDKTIQLFLTHSENDKTEDWQFYQFQVKPSIKMALAIRNKEKKLPYILYSRNIVPLSHIEDIKIKIDSASNLNYD